MDNLNEWLSVGDAAFSETEVIASICRESFWKFIQEFWSEVPGAGIPVWNWHMEVMANELQEMAELVFDSKPKDHDTIFNVPFGTSKSTICSILFHPWTWTRFPQARHLTATHTEMLALDLSSKSRDVIRSPKYQACFPEIRLRSDQDSKHYYMNTEGGVRQAFTVGGRNPMGFHFHFLGVDDPLDPQKAVSEAELKNAREFMNQTIPSRKVDKAISVTFLVMQRLDRRDPTAVMLERAKVEDAAKVKRYCLPGELTKNTTQEYRDRYVDGLLDPIRFPWSVLKEYRATLGQYGYSGQVLQEPAPPEGGMFKEQWFSKRVKAAPYTARRIRYWDRASTPDGGCATAGTLIATDGENYYVEHCEHGHWETDERDRRILACAQRDRARYGPNHEPLVVFEQEPGSSGVDAYRSIARKLAGFRVMPDKPTGDKDTRAEPWASQCEAGNVYVVDDGSWDVASYVEEHVLFKPDPTSGLKRGKLKDRVDSSTGSFNRLIGRGQPTSFRIVPFGGKRPQLRIVVCSQEELATTIIIEEYRCLLVCICEPKGVMCRNGRTETPGRSGSGEIQSVGGIGVNQAGQETSGGVPRPNFNSSPDRPLPAHGLTKLLDTLLLEFADIDPAEHQQTWGDILPQYGATAEQVRMSAEHGKKLWSFLTRKRAEQHEVIVIAGEGVMCNEDVSKMWSKNARSSVSQTGVSGSGVASARSSVVEQAPYKGEVDGSIPSGPNRSALSVACAVCDVLGLKREQTIYQHGQENDGGRRIEPENKYVFSMVKTSRGMVV